MKLIVAIFEGADYDILLHFSRLNLLPNFKKMSNINRLKCMGIPYEAAGLMSAFSGVKEYKHGISSYWKAKNFSYIRELWDSNDVKEKMIWNKPFMKKNKIGLINIWGTHPVYPINGCMVSYSMTKSLRYTYPDELSKRLIRKNISCVQDTCVLYDNNSVSTQFGNDVRRIDKLRHNVFLNMVDECDLSIINYTSIDRISHFLFNEYLTDAVNSELYLAYKQCDDILGQLLEIADKNKSDLIIFSEVGFGKLKKFININDELEKIGLLKYSNGSIDWEETFAFESVQGTHGVNLNRKGTFKKGIVNEQQYESVLNKTIEYLSGLKNSENGLPLFKKVIRSDEYYHTCINVPDIILEPYDQEYLPYGDPYWSNFLTRNNQTGWHRSNGFYALYSKKNIVDQDIYAHEMFDIISQHI